MPSETVKDMTSPMAVSEDRPPRRRTHVMTRVSMRANGTIDHIGSDRPKMTPSAMPVNAAWPIASEKKASRLATTTVPRAPSNGEMKSTASSARRMNSYCVQAKGSAESTRCQGSRSTALMAKVPS